MRRRLILCAICFFLAACAAKDPPEEQPTVVDSALVAEEIARAQCTRIFECCASAEIEDLFAGTAITSEEDCRTALEAQAEAFLIPTLDASQAQDSVVVHESALPACAEAIVSQSCEDFDPLAGVTVFGRTGCADLLEPRLTLSAFCAEDFECDTGFCSRPAGATEGACKNPPAAGESCLNDRCGEGLTCRSDETCGEKLGPDAVCTRNADCESENCVNAQDGTMTCRTAPRICTG